MKALVTVILLFCLGQLLAQKLVPQVQVYTRTPGFLGDRNTLICHAKNFYPPDIDMKLLKNGKEMDGVSQTDLAFENNWHYHLTKYVVFTPQAGEVFACRVNHSGQSNTYQWEPDM